MLPGALGPGKGAASPRRRERDSPHPPRLNVSYENSRPERTCPAHSRCLGPVHPPHVAGGNLGSALPRGLLPLLLTAPRRPVTTATRQADRTDTCPIGTG